MPRLRRTDKHRHADMIEVLCVLAHAAAYGDPEPWVTYWGGAAEARAACEALRHKRALGVKHAESYEEWLGRLVEHAKRHEEAADDEPDPDADATPWG